MQADEAVAVAPTSPGSALPASDDDRAARRAALADLAVMIGQEVFY